MDDFHMDFLGIGTIKSGTSLLADLIMQHPQVQWAQRKELNYFNKHQVNGSPNPYFDQPFSFYCQFFPDAVSPDVKRGEYSPVYIADADAMHRIQSLFPEIKLIITLRNPVDRAYSHFLYSRDFLQEISANTTFEEAWMHYPYFKNLGMYHNQLKRVLSLFSTDQCLVLIFEEMIQDPGKSAREVYRFIGVDDLFHPQITKVNTHKKVRYQWVENILNTIGQLKPSSDSAILKRFYNSPAYPALLDWKHQIRDANVQKSKKPEMPSDTYQRIMEMYKEDICLTEKLLKREILSWR